MQERPKENLFYHHLPRQYDKENKKKVQINEEEENFSNRSKKKKISYEENRITRPNDRKTPWQTETNQTIINCMICLDTAKTLKKLYCNHAFCGKCIDYWYLVYSETCPECRKYISWDEISRAPT